jgi:hypothetical protein
MKTTLLSIMTTLVGISLCGCASLDHKVAQPKGIGELIMPPGGREQTDLYPVERISNGSGRIATGHVRKDARGVYVAGYVEKMGPGFVTAAWSHIDVVVLDPKGSPTQKVTTKFFPSDIPTTQRGITGRSRYFVRLPSTPPTGSTVQVAFHKTPMSQCESGQKL